MPSRESRVKLTPKPMIGALLVQADVISQAQLDEAKAKGADIIDSLLALGHLEFDAFVDFLVNYPGIAPTDLIHFEIRQDLVGLIEPATANNFEVIPIDRRNGDLILGCANPLDKTSIERIEKESGLNVQTVLCAPEDILAAVLRYYPTAHADTDRETHIRGLESPMRLQQVAEMIRRIDSLPALPETVAQVRDAMNNPNTSVPAVVDIITLDPPIAAKVLGVANSAAYGFTHKIHELNLAVSLLGLRETYAIVLSASVVDLLNEFKNFDYRSFFLNAISCATASRIVARAAGRRNLPGIFSAGLLHDIGRPALWETVPELVKNIPAELHGRDLALAEEASVGTSHAEAGYLLAEHWGLPEEICQAIRFHHAPHRSESHQEHVAIVAIADAMTAVSGTKLEDHPGFFKKFERELDVLQIDQETAEAMLEEFLERYEAALHDAFG